MTAPIRRSHYIARILAAYPKLRIERLRLNDEGQYNDILVVNDDLIFRFPRHDEGIEKLEKEVALIQRIRPFITLPIPEPVYQAFVPRAVGQVFAGYRMLPGEPLWIEAFAAIADAGIVARLASQMAGFLRELHGIPPADLSDILPATDWQAGLRDLYAHFRGALFPHLPDDARARIADRFETFLSDPANFAFPPALIHGDFGTGNVLFDAHAGAVTGVIDFGSAGIGDPAHDVAVMLAYGDPFVRQGLAAYPAMERMLPRARFYLSTFPLHEALYGIEHGDPDAVERGLAPFMSDEEGTG